MKRKDKYDVLAEQLGGEVDYDAIAQEAVAKAAPPSPPPIQVQAKPTYPIPDPGFFWPSKQADWNENRLRNLNAQTNLQTAEINHSAHVEMSIQATDHELATLPTRLEEKDQLMKSVHETAITQNAATRHVTSEAAAKGLDVPTYGQLKLKQEEAFIEIQKAQVLSNIKVDEAKKMEKIRLEAYKQEVGTDLEALTFTRLLPHATVLGISGHLHRLFLERDNILNLSGISENTRKKMLSSHDKTIKAFEEDLRVQMARHLLKEGAGNNVQAIGEATDSPSGN